MTVYRIALSIYADKLLSSGNPARWNGKDVKMIYTAASRALACLENVVHRNSRGLESNFSVMCIQIPAEIDVIEIKEPDLVPDWREFKNMPYTQSLGNEWIKEGKTAILKVPSAIITGEFNYLLNPSHDDYSNIKLLTTEPFNFDSRIKANK